MNTTMNPEEAYNAKIKTYIRVAIILAVITAVEVALTFIPHDVQPMKTIITLAIVSLSCSKAFFVAYYYMHLNHEKSWTKWVAASPLCILIYAVFLIADAPARPPSVYQGEPARGVMYPTEASLGAEQEAAAIESSTGADDEGGEWE